MVPKMNLNPYPHHTKKKKYFKTYHKPKCKSQNYKNFRKQKKNI